MDGGGLFKEEGIVICDHFNARCASKFDDVFGGPVCVLIERVDDRFPGIKLHYPVEHFGVVDLDDETVENGGILRLSIINNLVEFGLGIGLVGVFGICDDVDVRICNHEVDEITIVESMVLAVIEVGKKIIGRQWSAIGVKVGFPTVGVVK